MSETELSHHRRPARFGVRFARDRRGAAAVEFALIAIPFFVFVAAIFELSLQLTSNFLLDRAAERVGRQVLTGQVQAKTIPVTKAQFQEKVCAEVKVLLKCSKLMVDLREYDRFDGVQIATAMKDGRVDKNKLRYELGGSSRINVLRLYYEWPWSFNYWSKISDGTQSVKTLSAIAAFRNEPF